MIDFISSLEVDYFFYYLIIFKPDVNLLLFDNRGETT